jgi:hypothetical protein
MASAFSGFRFPREAVVLAIRRYLRRDVKELLAEHGLAVDHVLETATFPQQTVPCPPPDPQRDRRASAGTLMATTTSRQ